MKTKGKAILFCRVSERIQTHSLAAYETELRQMAISDGYQDDDIVVIRETESASTKTLNERETIRQLKELIEKGNIAVVYSTDITRVVKKQADAEELFNYLIKNHIQFVTKTHIKDTRVELLKKNGQVNKTNLKVLYKLTEYAASETELQRKRTIRGIIQKKKEGKYHGQIPYGYFIDKDNHLHIKEEEAKIIRRIFTDIILFRKTVESVAEELIEEGYFKPTSKSVRSRITAMIKNEHYIGKENAPIIIPTNLFLYIKEIHNSSNSTFLLTGFLTDKNNNRYSQCVTDELYKQQSGKKSLSRKPADEIIWTIVKEHFTEYYEYVIDSSHKELLPLFNNDDFTYKKMWQKWLSEILDREKRKETTLINRWDAFLKERDDLYKKKINGKITEEKYKTENLRWSKSYYKKVHKVESKLNKIREKQAHIQSLLAASDSVPEFDSLSYDEKRVILYLCLNSLIVDKPSRYEIVFEIKFNKGKTIIVKYNSLRPKEYTIENKEPLALLPPSPKE